jgi:hypothetical protein
MKFQGEKNNHHHPFCAEKKTTKQQEHTKMFNTSEKVDLMHEKSVRGEREA